MRKELTISMAVAAALVAVAACGSSAKTAATHQPSATALAPATTTTTVPAPSKWTDSTLTIDGSSLGAVKVGMTLDEAQRAAGVAFDGNGDSASYPTKLPAGAAHPFVDSDSGSVFCVGARASQSGQQTQGVSTPEGFHLGDSVAKLKAIYGSRLVFVPAPPTGMDPHEGYTVTLPSGRLAFSASPNGKVYAIVAGKGFMNEPLAPSLCLD
jgi:hypothetical protein